MGWSFTRKLMLIAWLVHPSAELSANTMEDALLAYENGRYSDAFRMFEAPARAGQTLAQYHLGLMLESGKGVSRDYAQAARWYRQAADQHHAAAQFRLGTLHEYGLGIDRDYRLAGSWYEKATLQGHREAQDSLDFLRKRGLYPAASTASHEPHANPSATPTKKEAAVADHAEPPPPPAPPTRDVPRLAAPPTAVVAPLNAPAKASNSEMLSTNEAAPKNQLLEAICGFHASAIGDVAKASADIKGGDNLRFLLDHETTRPFPSAWCYFFSGAVIIEHAADDDPTVVAFFNPHLNGALITTWSGHDQEGLKLDGAACWRPPRLQEAHVVTRPPSLHTLSDMLRSHTEAFAAAFKQADPVTLLTSTGSVEAADYLAAASLYEVRNVLLATKQGSTNLIAPLERFISEMPQATPDKLKAWADSPTHPALEALGTLTPAERTRLMLHFVRPLQGGAEVLLHGPGQPLKGLNIVFRTEGSEPPMVAALIYNAMEEEEASP